MPKQDGSRMDSFFKNSATQDRGNKGLFKPEFGSKEKEGNTQFKKKQYNNSKDARNDFQFLNKAFNEDESSFKSGGSKNYSKEERTNFKPGKSVFNKFERNQSRHDNNTNDDEKLHEIKGGKVEKPCKQFDKKLYRMKKYSNKYKLDQWENRRRKEVLKKYYKDVKNDPMAGKYRSFKFDEGDSGVDETDKIHYVLHPDKLEEMKEKFGKDKNKKSNDRNRYDKIKPFKKVKEEMQRLKDEKVAAKEAKLKAAKEKEEAIARYKSKKAERFKKLSKKTKTGQPVMKDRMQMLLESIQKTM